MGSAMRYLPGKFVWFEHAGGDVAKARAFYEPLFGWRVEASPMGDAIYHTIHNGQQPIGGMRAAAAGAPPAWRSYLSVPDVDRQYRVALELGARSVLPPTDFGAFGRGATLGDPAGAVVSLWRDAEGDRIDEDPALGDWYWNELIAPDARQATAFYERLGGYTVEAMDLGQSEPYRVLWASGRPRAGVFQAPDPRMPPVWVPYVRVGDCDAIVDKAQQLGAPVCTPPADIPRVGRFAMLLDPQGAAIAVIRGTPAQR